MFLVRLVFFSRNCVNLSDSRLATIKSILHTCSEYSSSSGITGGLVFNERHFLQVMEGAREQISRNLKALFVDKRHEDVTVVSCRPIEERMFQGWSVGYAAKSLDAEQITMKFGLGVDLDPGKMTPHGIEAFVAEFCRGEGLHVQHSDGFERTRPHPAPAPAAAPAPAPVTERIKVSMRN